MRRHDQGAGHHHRQALAARAALRRAQAGRRKISEVGVVGDDPLVEMIMARRGGATGFGVCTGTTSRAQWAKQPLNRRPHRVLENVGELLA